MTGDDSSNHPPDVDDSAAVEPTEPVRAIPLDSLHLLAAESAEMPRRFVRKLRVTDFAPRAFAHIIDFAVLFVGSGAATFTLHRLEVGAMPVAFLGITVIWWLIACSDVWFGGTPGKHVMGLRLRDTAGRRPPSRKLLLRMFVRRPLLLCLTLWTVGNLVRQTVAPTTSTPSLDPLLFALGGFVQLAVLILAASGEGPHDLLSGTRLFEQSELILTAITSNVRIDAPVEGHAFTVTPTTSTSTSAVEAAESDFVQPLSESGDGERGILRP